jgi:hypothetical protein
MATAVSLSPEVRAKYAVIGLEVHVQLLTETNTPPAPHDPSERCSCLWSSLIVGLKDSFCIQSPVSWAPSNSGAFCFHPPPRVRTDPLSSRHCRASRFQPSPKHR